MLTGIALALSEVPLEFIERHILQPRLHERGGERELHFLFSDGERVLPVWHAGHLKLLPWGNRRGESATLPLTDWAHRESFEAGAWAAWHPVEAIIPATLGLDGKVWFAPERAWHFRAAGALALALSAFSGSLALSA